MVRDLLNAVSAHDSADSASDVTGCVRFADLFQDRLLEEPPTSSANARDRQRSQMLTQRAENICLSCPMMRQCLYSAVAEHDVAGYVAGTTAKQRQELRTRLGISVQPEDFDTLAGVTARHRQVDHEEILRLRRANPHESLETLAQRLGCSLSTVKRHLRRARSESSAQISSLPANPTVTPDDVMTAYGDLGRTDSKARTAA